jgi:hypothetical protein
MNSRRFLRRFAKSRNEPTNGNPLTPVKTAASDWAPAGVGDYRFRSD